MPALGADMDSGTVVEWRVGPGDVVHRGDIVAVVDTEKSDIEVEVFEDGVVDALLVGPGEEVPVGTPLARLRTTAEGSGPAPSPPPAPAPVAEAPVAPAPVGAARAQVATETPTAPPTHPTPSGRARVSPRARRRAAEEGMDLAAVTGTGPGGAVVSDDLEPLPPGSGSSAPPRPAPSDPAARRAALHRATGALVARSAREIPHYRLATTVDLRAATRWLEAANAARPVTDRLVPAAVLLRATALAARQVTGINGTYDGAYHPAGEVHLGVAVALRGGGLVAPVIHDAAALGVADLMAALRDLVARSRAGTLRSSEVAGATLTVTNLGDRGADEVHGLIHPPQVALVGFGRVRERPWAEDGMVGVRPTVRATLAADHRVTDGHDGSRFLDALDRLLQHPEDL